MEKKLTQVLVYAVLMEALGRMVVFRVKVKSFTSEVFYCLTGLEPIRA